MRQSFPGTLLFAGWAITLVLAANTACAQQVSDTLFAFQPMPPAYEQGAGPVIAIDGGHHNFHTADGRFRPFAILAERDGFRVRAHDGVFTDSSLVGVDILVVANAMSERNLGQWVAPSYPAFTAEEIAVVRGWVERGGSLLLIADHMPFGGAAADLARSFGAQFTDGFTVAPGAQQPQPDRFVRTDGTLNGDHPLLDLAPAVRGDGESAADMLHSNTDGADAATPPDGGSRTTAGLVDSLLAFTGQGFLIDERLEPVLLLPPDTEVWLPDTAWVFNDATTHLPGDRWVQGATAEVGKGRVALFGEAAMFTAQRAGQNGQWRIGFTHPGAPHNSRFVLATLRWLVEDGNATQR